MARELRAAAGAVGGAGVSHYDDRLEVWMLLGLIVAVAAIAGSLWMLVELLDTINPPPTTLAPALTAG